MRNKHKAMKETSKMTLGLNFEKLKKKQLLERQTTKDKRMYKCMH